MKVLKAGPEDSGLVAPLFNAYRVFYGQDPDAGLARAFLGERLSGGESAVFVALERLEDADAPTAVEFAQLYPSFSSVSAKRIWILNDLFVAPEARGRGVGAALLECARGFAVQTGAAKLVLATAPDNVPAQRLYEASGWRRDPFFHYQIEAR